jgi:hypothetical protein
MLLLQQKQVSTPSSTPADRSSPNLCVEKKKKKTTKMTKTKKKKKKKEKEKEKEGRGREGGRRNRIWS